LNEGEIMADYFIAIDGQQQQGPFPAHELPGAGMRRIDGLV